MVNTYSGCVAARLGTVPGASPVGISRSGKTPLSSAARELAEETGLELSGAYQAGWFCHADAERRYLTLYVRSKAYGEPQLLEPTKCERWVWFSPEALPQALFVPTAGYFDFSVAAQPMDDDSRR